MKNNSLAEALRVGFTMVEYPEWNHVEGVFYEYKGDLYDLSRADLSKLEEKVVGNTFYIVKKGYKKFNV